MRRFGGVVSGVAVTALCAALGAGAMLFPVQAPAQASTIQSGNSVQRGPAAAGEDRGRKLLDAMVAALGGDAWRQRQTWTAEGKAATFYKGAPNPGVISFEEFHRERPFAERVEIISKTGVFIPTAHRDIVQVWTADNGYEVTYRGKKEMPRIDVAEFQKRRHHQLDAVMDEWLAKPGVVVVYEGTSMVARHLTDKVSILSADNDAVTIEMDEASHLPLAMTYESRNETYKDHDEYREEYDDYHVLQGVMTALTVTRFRNGDMTGQRFYTKVTYGTSLAPALFDPDRPLMKK